MHPLIEKAKQEKRHLLEPEALALLRAYGINVPEHVLIHSEQEALAAAEAIGRPVVMKIVSRSILHKTESGGVFLKLGNDTQVKEAFARLNSLLHKDSASEAILVCPFQEAKLELSAGMLRDPQFGPVITFGLGGIWIEALKDIAYGIAPLSNEEAEEMLLSLRARPLLEGARGSAPVDRRAVCELLVRLSRLAMAETAIREMDLNPVFPMRQGYFIADARVIL